MRKRFIIFGILLPFVFLVIGMLVRFNADRPTKKSLIDFFEKNQVVFEYISKYLEDNKQDISIDKRQGSSVNDIAEIYTDEGVKSFTISDELVDDIRMLLYKKGFVAIYEEGDFIYFDKSVGFQWHQALVYSKSGKSPPLHRERDFEHIDDKWYYYYGE